jgi:NitT/TauT family transport system substrate-binding protein
MATLPAFGRYGSVISRRRALGLLGSAFAAGTPGRASAAARIQAGYLPVASSTPIYLAAANAWADSDLQVDPLRLPAGPAIVQAIQSGSIPVGEIACTVALISASRGIPLVALASVNGITRDFPYNRIMVAKDSPLHSIADLKGKSVGVLGIGTIDHLELLVALNVAKIDTSDVKVVTIPVPNQPQVLASGQVDAMMMPPPADSVAEIQYGARTLADATDSLPYIPLEYLVADARWAEQNPDVVHKLVIGWIKGARWIEANRAAAQTTAQHTLNLAPEIAAKIRLPYWQANGLPIMPGVWNLYYAMTEAKLSDPAPDPEAMIQQHFVEPTMKYTLPALNELGRVADPEADKLGHLKLPYLKKNPEDYFASWEKK